MSSGDTRKNGNSDQKQRKNMTQRKDQDSTALCELTSSLRCSIGDEARGACACPSTDETSLKSSDPASELAKAPCLTLDAASRASDISLDRHSGTGQSPGSSTRSVNSDSGVASNVNFRTESSAQAYAERSTAEADRQNLPLNIPFSMPRIDNTQVSTGLAEQQPSFTTTETVVTGLLSMPQHEAAEPPSNIVAKLGPAGSNALTVPCEDPIKYLESEISSYEENISVSPGDLPHNVGTARPIEQGDVRPQQPNSTGNGAAGGGNGSRRGPQLSHSSSVISQSSAIPENCLIRKLPRKIIRFLASHLDIGYSGSWKDLVELHGWNYEETYLFQHRQHPDGFFCALLHEAAFQQYTLNQLKEDLQNLPRYDILDDLELKIAEHNSRALTQSSF